MFNYFLYMILVKIQYMKKIYSQHITVADPVNYNAEGSYATKLEEPMHRVLELQNLVDTLHKMI